MVERPFQKPAGFQGLWKERELLANHSYYRIGGPAQAVVTPKGVEDLVHLAVQLADGSASPSGASAQSTPVPVFFLGLGSNVLFDDAGFGGVVIKTGLLNTQIIEIQDSTYNCLIEVGAGVPIATLLRKASERGWGGLAFLAGVPGSVGGACVMNAGTHLGEIKDRVHSVRVLDLTESGLSRKPQVREYAQEELIYAYRSNSFIRPGQLVLSAQFRVDLKDPSIVKAEIDQVLKRRKDSQPVELPSCGSVFKNPIHSSGWKAWQVIERLGLRGHQVGGAQFSPKHCNFIVNTGGAKASDVRALIRLAQDRAKRELGVDLQTEVVLL